MRDPKADWKGISSDERREHGHVGAEVLVEGAVAIKNFLCGHIGRGRLGNDYHNAFGRAFNEFYFREDQPAYRPICAVLAEYVREMFRFTGQEKVFGTRTPGRRAEDTTLPLRARGIGLKITAQALKEQHGIWLCASHEVDPDLIARLAPKLKGLLDAGDAARHLGVGIDVFRGLVRDRVLGTIGSTTGWPAFPQRPSMPSSASGVKGARYLESGEAGIIYPFRSLRARTGCGSRVS